MTTQIVLSVLVIVLLIAGLAFYLYVVGSQLTRVATNLEACAELVRTVERNASVIQPGVEQINHTGGVIAGALPLLYGMAEGIVVGATYEPGVAAERGTSVSGLVARELEQLVARNARYQEAMRRAIELIGTRSPAAAGPGGGTTSARNRSRWPNARRSI